MESNVWFMGFHARGDFKFSAFFHKFVDYIIGSGIVLLMVMTHLDAHSAGVAGHVNLLWGGAHRTAHPLRL